MIIDIPFQNPLRQTNKGDVSGSIGETFNIDLDHYPSKICLPNKVRLNTSNDSLTELGLITKFVFFDGEYHAYSAGTDSGTYSSVGKLFRGGDSVQNSFSLPSWTVNTTDYNSDATIEAFNGELILMSSNIWSITTSSDTSWTAEGTDSCSGFSVKFEDRVYYTGFNRKIESFLDPATPTTSGSYTFSLPNQSEGGITGLDASTAGIWISTSSEGSPETYVYIWDGQTENEFDGAYKVPEPYIMNLKVLNDIPYVVGGSGKIYGFNGSYFEEVAKFPFADMLLANVDDSERVDILTSLNGKWIHNNGSTVYDNKLYFLVNPIAQDDSEIFGDYSKLAGIWCLDPEIGLYHKHAISVEEDNGEMGMLKHVGALTTSGIDSNPNPTDAGTFIFGFSYYTENSNSTEKYAIGYVEPSTNVGYKQNGYLTSQRIYSQQLTDSWDYIAVGFEELESTDTIELKYRTKEREGNNIAITWTSTTTFTSTDTDLADVKSKFDNDEGYECRILLGSNSGIISQLSNITESGGTYTITLDTVHTGATGTGQARLENWESAQTITNTDNDTQIVKIPVGKQSNWLQYKLVLRGEENSKNKHNPVINRIVSVSNDNARFD